MRYYIIYGTENKHTNLNILLYYIILCTRTHTLLDVIFYTFSRMSSHKSESTYIKTWKKNINRKRIDVSVFIFTIIHTHVCKIVIFINQSVLHSNRRNKKKNNIPIVLYTRRVHYKKIRYCPIVSDILGKYTKCIKGTGSMVIHNYFQVSTNNAKVGTPARIYNNSLCV